MKKNKRKSKTDHNWKNRLAFICMCALKSRLHLQLSMCVQDIETLYTCRHTLGVYVCMHITKKTHACYTCCANISQNDWKHAPMHMRAAFTDISLLNITLYILHRSNRRKYACKNGVTCINCWNWAAVGGTVCWYQLGLVDWDHPHILCKIQHYVLHACTSCVRK